MDYASICLREEKHLSASLLTSHVLMRLHLSHNYVRATASAVRMRISN